MSKFLVVSYSYTGTSRQVAQTLCEMQAWDQAEIKDREARAGWSGTVRCVLDSLFRRAPEIQVPALNLLDYDAVVLVSPIWAYRLAGPMRSFVAQNRHALPDVAVISVMGSRGAPNAEAEIAALLGRTPMLSTAFTAVEIGNGSYAGRLDAFGSAIRKAKEQTQALRPAMWSAAGG
jgi:hypothetical protein